MLSQLKPSFHDNASSQCDVADHLDRRCDCGHGLAGSGIAYSGLGEEDHHPAFRNGNGIRNVYCARVSGSMELGGQAFLGGAIGLAYPLLRTSRLVREGETVMAQRSHAFFAVVILLAGIRIAARGYLDTVLSVQQTASLFFILAFGMILRWRTQMFFQYRALINGPRPSPGRQNQSVPGSIARDA